MMMTQALLSTRSLMGVLAAGLLFTNVFGFAHANEWRNDGRRLWQNQVVRQAVIGAGVGAAAGVITDRPIGRSAGVGAITGAGTGLVDQTGVLRRRPMARTAVKGAIIGTGASTVMGRSKLQGAAIGAGAGAATHLVRDYWRTR